MGGGNSSFVQRIARLGALVGLAFQIRDDILDVTATTAQLGKPVGSDIKNEKATYVAILGLEKAQAVYDRLSQEAMALVQEIPCKTNSLQALVTQITQRNM